MSGRRRRDSGAHKMKEVSMSNDDGTQAADVEMSQYVADRARVNEDKIRQDDEIIN